MPWAFSRYIVLGIAALAEYTGLFGRKSRYVAAVSYSATVFFHMIPAVTETTTRLPSGAPLFADADAPGLQLIGAALFVVFLIGAVLQVRFLRGRERSEGGTALGAFSAAQVR